MNLYTSSPPNAAIDEINNPPSSFYSPFHIWQQPILQGDFNLQMVHAPSQIVTPTIHPSLHQYHVTQYNSPLFPQPSICVCQQHCGHSSVQGDTGLELPILSQHLASPAVSHRQIVQLNASIPPQPSHHVYQDAFPMQGDPGPLHVPSSVVSHIQTKTPAVQKQVICPYCKRKFRRNQEQRRHLLSNLPDSIHCPFPLCPWTGHRHYSLMEHMKAHPNPDPGRRGREYERKEFQLYDAEKLVDLMASSTLTVERAANMALSDVKKRFGEQDKAGVEASVWGSRRKFCTARSWRS